MEKLLFIIGNGTDWCEKSLLGFNTNSEVYLVNKKLPVNGFFLSKLARIFFSKKINLKLIIYIRILFYKQIITQIKDFSKGKSIDVLIYDHNKFAGKEDFIKVLRSIKNVSSVNYIFTNIVKHSAANENSYLNNLNNWYDVVFAFDPEDAKNYNFAYSPLIYDADPDYKKVEKESDDYCVFYVGQAKDRLRSLLSIYEKLNKIGIKTEFHIANVKKEDIKYSNEIIYNKFITYDACVEAIHKATCILDVIQGDSTGLTIKTCEAICYNKKLITTNQYIKEYSFYDPRYIRIVNSLDDIDKTFFTENLDVHYSEEGKKYFSAEKFLERLGEELKQKKNCDV